MIQTIELGEICNDGFYECNTLQLSEVNSSRQAFIDELDHEPNELPQFRPDIIQRGARGSYVTQATYLNELPIETHEKIIAIAECQLDMTFTEDQKNNGTISLIPIWKNYSAAIEF